METVTKNRASNRRSSTCLRVSASKCKDGLSCHSCRTHSGLCCVCHSLPVHSRTYYGQVFCTTCFHKYIWSPSKRDCSGDVEKVKRAADNSKK